LAIVSPDMAVEMPGLMKNTRWVPPPLTVSRPAPLPMTVVGLVSPVKVMSPLVRTMVSGVASRKLVPPPPEPSPNTMVSASVFALAAATVFRSEPAPVSLELRTVKIAGA
jgi:hypothetical protein